MSKYDEIENIHSYHGTREHIGVDVSGIEIDNSKVIEYSKAIGEAAKDDMELIGWQVTSSWCVGVDTVYGMRRESRKSLLFDSDGNVNEQTKADIRRMANESFDKSDAVIAKMRKRWEEENK